MMVRKEFWNDTGGFEDQRRFGEFIHWYSGLDSELFKEQTIPEVLVKRRIHLTNASRSQKEQTRAAYLEAVRGRILKNKQN